MAGKDNNNYTGAALLGQLGFTIAIPIILGIAMGRFLDNHFEKAPMFLVIFLLLGIAAGLVGAYRQINMTTGSQSGKGGKAKR